MIRKRPWQMFFASCLVVLLASWFVTLYIADRMLSSLPEQTTPEGPRPLTQDEIAAQIR